MVVEVCSLAHAIHNKEALLSMNFFSILSLLIHFEMLLTYFICLFCAWEDLEYSKTMRICEPKINKWRLLKWGKTSLEKRLILLLLEKMGLIFLGTKRLIKLK